MSVSSVITGTRLDRAQRALHRWSRASDGRASETKEPSRNLTLTRHRLRPCRQPWVRPADPDRVVHKVQPPLDAPQPRLHRVREPIGQHHESGEQTHDGPQRGGRLGHACILPVRTRSRRSHAPRGRRRSPRRRRRPASCTAPARTPARPAGTPPRVRRTGQGDGAGIRCARRVAEQLEAGQQVRPDTGRRRRQRQDDAP